MVFSKLKDFIAPVDDDEEDEDEVEDTQLQYYSSWKIRSDC